MNVRKKPAMRRLRCPKYPDREAWGNQRQKNKTGEPLPEWRCILCGSTIGHEVLG